MAIALGKKKNHNRGIVGLDLDGEFIAAVQIGADGISNAVSAELPPGVITDGEVTDVPALSDALRDFFKAHSLPKRVRLGVSNQQIVVRHLELPKIENPDELAVAVRFQAAEAIAMPLDEVVLDYQVVGETITPEGATRLRIVVVAARESMVSRVVEAVRGAGLRPEGIDLNAFALVRTLALPADSAESARVYCHLAGVTNLAIAIGPICLFTRPLSTAWQEDDEQAAAAALAEEIRLSVDFYMAQPEARWVGEVVLSGPGAERDGLAERLGSMIDVPVSVADPLGRLQSTQIPAGEDPYRHTVAVGLALGATA
jgi:type IV pilus assembly protein PilM